MKCEDETPVAVVTGGIWLRCAEALLAHTQCDRIAAVTPKGLGAGLVGTPELVASRIRYEVGITCQASPPSMLDGLRLFVDRVILLLRDVPIYRAPQC